MTYQFSPDEEQILGRLFIEHVRAAVPSVSFFEVFKHLAWLDTAVEAEAVADDDFDGIVADVPRPEILEHDAGVLVIADYLAHGGNFVNIERWLGIAPENALDVMALAIPDDDAHDQEVMLAWSMGHWADIEEIISRSYKGPRRGYWSAHTEIVEDMGVSDASAERILGWYGRFSL